MSHSLYKVWIHSILITKDRYNYIKEPIESKIYSHISQMMLEQFSSPVKIINGTENHLHMLFLLNCKYPVSEIMKNVKGNT